MSATLFLLKKVITALVMPPLGPLLLTIAGLLITRRWPRTGKACVWSSVAILLILSLPMTAAGLSRAVDLDSGLGSAAAGTARAIVILGGGRRVAPEFGGETVSGSTLQRLHYGARLARQRQLPVLVSGGSPGSQAVPEGELMAVALEQSFGTSVQWKELRSRDTHENAIFSAAILQAAGIRSVLLVTDDIHERRGVAEFRAEGIEAVPAPVMSSAAPAEGDLLSAYLPNASALRQSALALHEILGNIVLAL
jgi:uncharacterized SAM-binding protein YcdF (DUF218 family)